MFYSDAATPPPFGVHSDERKRRGGKEREKKRRTSPLGAQRDAAEERRKGSGAFVLMDGWVTRGCYCIKYGFLIRAESRTDMICA